MKFARLKGQKPKPKIKPSGLESRRNNESETQGKRPGSAKRHKTKALKAPLNLPLGSTFKGYNDFVVQGLRLKPFNIRYRLERWLSPDGRSFTGKLPENLNGGHFDLEFKRFILYQYYHAHVTQPILLEQLHDMGFEISAGQLNNILIEGHESFHDEKDAILDTGLSVSSHINVDDTSARHKAQNGYCTHVGNDFFATFHSTESKSRINFLKILQAGHTDYVLNASALSYMISQGLPQESLTLITTQFLMVFENDDAWMDCLKKLGIKKVRHIRIATEGALIGSLVVHGFRACLKIIFGSKRRHLIMI